MFRRVNSKCAHQVRPPPGRIQGSAAFYCSSRQACLKLCCEPRKLNRDRRSADS